MKPVHVIIIASSALMITTAARALFSGDTSKRARREQQEIEQLATELQETGELMRSQLSREEPELRIMRLGELFEEYVCTDVAASEMARRCGRFTAYSSATPFPVVRFPWSGPFPTKRSCDGAPPRWAVFCQQVYFEEILPLHPAVMEAKERAAPSVLRCPGHPSGVDWIDDVRIEVNGECR